MRSILLLPRDYERCEVRAEIVRAEIVAKSQKRTLKTRSIVCGLLTSPIVSRQRTVLLYAPVFDLLPRLALRRSRRSFLASLRALRNSSARSSSTSPLLLRPASRAHALAAAS